MKNNYEAIKQNYTPRAVEHDLIVIRQLMGGKKTLNMQLAQDIYYKIYSEGICFESYKGAEFLEQLSDNITEHQMHEIEKKIDDKRQRRKQTRAFIRLNRKIATGMFCGLLVLLIVIFNWNVILDFRTNYETDKLQNKIVVNERVNTEIEFDNLVESVSQIKDTIERKSEADNNSKAIAVLDKYKALYEENSDFSGWLRIDGTRIDYPVMSRDGDNNYYLDKNFEGKKDKNGLLILDYRSDVLAQGQNIIIYGHNMRTGVMFGTLKNYKDKSFCESHSVISFDSLYEENEYKVVAALLSEVAYEDEDVFRYYEAIDISTEESFNEFYEHILKNALYTTDEILKYGDSCLVLSTCDNYKEDGRFVVIARKIN